MDTNSLWAMAAASSAGSECPKWETGRDGGGVPSPSHQPWLSRQPVMERQQITCLLNISPCYRGRGPRPRDLEALPVP